MLKIAILNSKNKEETIISFLVKYNVEYNVCNYLTVFLSAEDLCTAVSRKQKFDLIFINLSMTADDTLNIIDYIRNKSSRKSAGFVFISPKEEAFSDEIKTYAFECLTYPVTYEKIKYCLDIYMRDNLGDSGWFRYTQDRCKHKIKASKIIYLEGHGRKTILYTKNSKIEFYSKLSDCAKEKCFSSFLNVHKSFLVNPVYVEQAESKYLTVNRKVQIPISRRKMKTIAEFFR